jgi:1-acyl-sn-glycerol-3-phosphate acyltransferase
MNQRFYDFSKATVQLMARTLWRAQASGMENVPRDGPLIVACNHVSYLDPPVMGSFCPRRISYMAKKELFTIPVLGSVIRGDVMPQAGVALLASLAKAPVVPACILGSDRALRLGRIKVAFGPPLALPADRKASRDALAKFTDEIMSAIRTLAESMGGDT